MSVHLSKQQLDQLREGTSGAVVVQDSATKRKYAVLSEVVYRRAQPLLELISGGADPGGTERPEQWTDADNDRRLALINKKHDGKLTNAEQAELRRLHDRAYQHRNQVAPVRNEVLKLLLEALEHRANSGD